jgi:hypothetical protein
MRKLAWVVLLVASLAGAGDLAFSQVLARAGGYVCPLTGEVLPCPRCCPLNGTQDGRPFVCPLTGEELPCPGCCPLNN